jgi:hypothetical protein
MLRVRFSEKSKQLIVSENNVQNYFELIDKQCIDIFLPPHRKYTIVKEHEPADICIIGIQHTDNTLLRENELNIFLSLENFSVARGHYQHFNKFHRFKNPMIKLYIYNDICIPRDNVIPVIYQRMNYFNRIKNNCLTLTVPFHEKKFCLFTSRNMLNTNKQIVYNTLQNIRQVDTLDQYNHIIKNKSCYNSIELLRIFNQYKFIITFENSNTQGYITEKIFNVFLAKSIPIYDGDPNIGDFINSESFLQYDNKIIQKVQLLMHNEELYNAVVNKEKTKELDYTFINDNFDRLISDVQKDNNL